MNKHSAILIRNPKYGERVEIDAAIAPLIRSMWRLDWQTFNSCEDNFGYVWMEMDPSSAEQFLTVVAQSTRDTDLQRVASAPTQIEWRKPRDLHVPPEDPNEWLINVHSFDANEIFDVEEDHELIRIGPPHIRITISVRFPKHWLGQVTALVQSYRAVRSAA